MCCVMPPASRDVTFVERIASRRLVFPWSTWPSTVTTGGRSFSFAGSTSSRARSTLRWHPPGSCLRQLASSRSCFRAGGELASQPVRGQVVDRGFKGFREDPSGEAALEARRVRVEVCPAPGRLSAKVHRELPQRGAYDADEIPFCAGRPAGDACPLRQLPRRSRLRLNGARASSCLRGARGPPHPGPPRPQPRTPPRPPRRGHGGWPPRRLRSPAPLRRPRPAP